MQGEPGNKLCIAMSFPKDIHPTYRFLLINLAQIDLGGLQVLMTQDHLGHDFRWFLAKHLPCPKGAAPPTHIVFRPRSEEAYTFYRNVVFSAKRLRVVVCKPFFLQKAGGLQDNLQFPLDVCHACFKFFDLDCIPLNEHQKTGH
jgi:hypothetical protein